MKKRAVEGGDNGDLSAKPLVEEPPNEPSLPRPPIVEPPTRKSPIQKPPVQDSPIKEPSRTPLVETALKED